MNMEMKVVNLNVEWLLTESNGRKRFIQRILKFWSKGFVNDVGYCI